MVALIRDTRNILFHSSALTISALNIALGFDIDIVDDSIIANIIFNNNDKNNEVKDHSIHIHLACLVLDLY